MYRVANGVTTPKVDNLHIIHKEKVNMKKFWTILLVVLLTFTLFVTVACDNTHPIEKFKQDMDDANNFKAKITATASMGGMEVSIPLNIEVDGDVMHIDKASAMGSTLMEETYFQEVDGKTYMYTQDGLGNWEKSEYDAETDESTSVDFAEFDELFNPDNYEKAEDEDNVYVQKADAEIKVDETDVEDATFTLDDGTATITFSINMEGIVMQIELKFFKLGEVKLTLPTVAE